jgi:glyoxylase-like metal-dependent hydrolase (beta-lactamase superfamily II)
MLVKGSGKNILVDTGMGQKWDEKSKGMYKISASFLEVNLAKAGLAPDDITDVILTHLHFDHAGGAVRLVDGKLIPTFKNATYYVQDSNYRWAMNPNAREKVSYMKDNFLPLMEAGKLKLIEGEIEIFPNVHLIISNAHTHGQQLVCVKSPEKSVCYCGDLIPTATHIPLPWVMGYDLYPLEIMNEKKKLLEQAVDENWTLFFEHDPYADAADLVRSEKGIAKREAFALN